MAAGCRDFEPHVEFALLGKRRQDIDKVDEHLREAGNLRVCAVVLETACTVGIQSETWWVG